MSGNSMAERVPPCGGRRRRGDVEGDDLVKEKMVKKLKVKLSSNNIRAIRVTGKGIPKRGDRLVSESAAKTDYADPEERESSV